jgi:vesicle-associated membrane protein-associated protein A
LEAQAEIARLKQLVANLQNSGMRRRAKVLSDDGTSVLSGDNETVFDGETVIEHGIHTEGGVPLQIVLAIAVGVFTLTYLFF